MLDPLSPGHRSQADGERDLRDAVVIALADRVGEAVRVDIARD